MRVWAFSIGLALVLVGSTGVVQAQAKRVKRFQRDMQIERMGERLLVSFACPEVFSARVRQRLSSGFSSRMEIRLQVRDHKSKKPVAEGVLHYTIRYDIWEERFAVRVEGPGNRKDHQMRTMDELVEVFGVVRRLQALGLSEYKAAQKVQVTVQVVVNPTSAELRRKVREYVSNPDGRRAIGSPRSFFGSYSRVFVDEKKIQADEVLTYRSTSMQLPASSVSP
jgi:hypothetical protein